MPAGRVLPGLLHEQIHKRRANEPLDMGKGDRKAEPAPSLNNFVWLALVLGGLVLVQALPWQGSRPPGVEVQVYQPTAEAEADARLWQDPLAAVARARSRVVERRAGTAPARARGEVDCARSDAVPPHSLCKLAHEIAKSDGSNEVLLLGVMVSGAGYPDLAEFRRRARYALLAGASQFGLVPQDPEHVGYFAPGSDGVPLSGKLPPFIAYEWLNRSGPAENPARLSRVLVLWLDADFFITNAVEQLGWLAGRLEQRVTWENAASKEADSASNAAPARALPFVVLGPADSDGLVKLGQEVKQRSRDCNLPGKAGCDHFNRGRHIEFYSYGATSSDQHVLGQIGTQAGSSEDSSGSLQSFFTQHGLPHMYRTIGDDEQLAAALVEELNRRMRPLRTESDRPCGRGSALPCLPSPGASVRAALDGPSRPAQPPQRLVVLIAERDTDYSRFLRHCLATKLHDPPASCQATEPLAQGPNGRHGVFEFSYLRGLDGQLPGAQPGSAASGADSAPAPDPDTSPGLAAGQAEGGHSDGAGLDRLIVNRAEQRIERAEGQGQVDYLRRLSARMRALQSEQRAPIVAVGVLGTDLYDKLLILQALRPQFRDAVFFTTDLDARLMHPRERAWSRNLIVASSFGLQLRPDLQGDTAPFRDSYQTAVYLSTLTALHNARWRPLACARGAPAGDDGHGAERCGTIGGGTLRRWLSAPQVFEIGRREAFLLTAAPPLRLESFPVTTLLERLAGDDPQCGPPQPPPLSGTIHPAGPAFFPQPDRAVVRQAGAVGLIGLTAWGLATDWHGRVRRWLRRWLGRRWRGPFAALCVAAAAALVAAIVLGWQAQAAATQWSTLGRWLTENGEGEPLTFTHGISIWPIELLRLLSIGLCVLWVLRGWGALSASDREIPKRLGMLHELQMLRARLALPEPDRLRRAWRQTRRMFRYRLAERGGLQVDPQTGLAPAAEAFWTKYLHQGRWEARLARVSLMTVVYLLAAWLLNGIIGEPMVPSRGLRADWADRWLAWISELTMYFLILFVADAMILCRHFVAELHPERFDRPSPEMPRDHSVPPRWPDALLEHHAGELCLPTRYLGDWLGLHVIAWRTRVVNRLIYYPFVAVSLLIVARSPLFDRSSLSTGSVIVAGAGIAIVSACAVWLRMAAERYRRRFVQRLSDGLIAAQGTGDSGSADRIRSVIDRAESFEDGAFAPYSQQPVARALLLLLSSLGGTTLLEFLSLAPF